MHCLADMVSTIEGQFNYTVPYSGWKDLKLPFRKKDSKPFDECAQEFSYEMEDGSKADANLIINPNDAVFLYDGPDLRSLTVDATIVTVGSVSRVNLHVDCGTESPESETIASVTSNALGIESLSFFASN